MAVWHLARGMEVTNVSMLGPSLFSWRTEKGSDCPYPLPKPTHLCLPHKAPLVLPGTKPWNLSSLEKPMSICPPPKSFVQPRWCPDHRPAATSQTLKGGALSPHGSQGLVVTDTSQAVQKSESAWLGQMWVHRVRKGLRASTLSSVSDHRRPPQMPSRARVITQRGSRTQRESRNTSDGFSRNAFQSFTFSPVGPKVSEGPNAYSIIEVNLGLPHTHTPLFGKKKKKTTPDSRQMFYFFSSLNAKASFSCQNWNDWSASFKTFYPILSHLREQKITLILIFLLSPRREECSLNSPPNYCQHHRDVKSGEATEAGLQLFY